MEQVAAEALPEGYELAWTGTAYQETRDRRHVDDACS